MGDAREHLTAEDTAWLRMDQPTNAMTITAVLELDGELAQARIEEIVREGLLPHRRFRARVVDPGLPSALPHWEPDPHFDLRNHLRRVALPAPHDRAALEALVSDLMSTPLDRTRPLWQAHVVEGVRGDDGGVRTAVVVRLHHVVGDGVALVRLLLSLIDEPGVLAQRVGLPEARPRSWGDALWTGAHGLATLVRLLLIPADSRTVLRGELGTAKRAAWSRPIPLDAVRAVAKRVDGKLNDALQYGLATAVRAYLLARGGWDGSHEVRALVPVFIQGAGAKDRLGNHIGLVYFTLPVSVADDDARLRECKRRMDAIKSTDEATVAMAVLGAMGVASRLAEQVGVDVFTRKASMLITNVPGPTQPVHLAGRTLRTLMVWAPVSGHVGVGLSLISYAGAVRLGVATDALLVADPDALVRAFEQAFVG